VRTELKEHLAEFPPPQAGEAGWYPDPLGSTAERFWDGEWLDIIRTPQLRLPPELAGSNGSGQRRPRGAGLRLPSLRRSKPAALKPATLPPLKKSVREQRGREREQRRALLTIEAKKDAFFVSPAGRARRAFERGQRLFQYELELGEREPLEIPGVDGEPARATSDPVDILNAVVAEGWKLETGTFFFVEARNRAIGCYLFKRSKKRRQTTTDPWQG
jgi:Protein of unknown function (DUF2510)